ncbi:hypothetical protein W822_18795 [Advenella kashmirensis W13003]|uniref:Uncharacterized protein n=1 Tax=Advenella kashmirensis W13003 TaxID=1424334 RepID=V8QN66_9BURK|nr:hypothetical protein W822_18795 [Advenella kashmirensis W13003]
MAGRRKRGIQQMTMDKHEACKSVIAIPAQYKQNTDCASLEKSTLAMIGLLTIPAL